MTLTEYEEKASALGIDRGRFARGFDAEPSTIAGYKDEATNWKKSGRVRPPPAEVPDNLIVVAKLPTMVALLAKRGESIATLAKRAGWAECYVRRMLSSYKCASTGAIIKMKSMLTQEEWLEWISEPKK